MSQIRYLVNKLSGLEPGEYLDIPPEVNLESVRARFNEEQRALANILCISERKYARVSFGQRRITIQSEPIQPSGAIAADKELDYQLRLLKRGLAVAVPDQDSVHRLYYAAKKAGIHVRRKRRATLGDYLVWDRHAFPDEKFKIIPDVAGDI